MIQGRVGADLHPDACLARARLVVEMNSIEWHRLGDRVEATERRRARYAALGWTVLPVHHIGSGMKRNSTSLRSKPAFWRAWLEQR